MKKVLSVFLVVVMIVTALPLTNFNLSASAQTEGYYEYEVNNEEATITGVSSSISGDITIPSTLGGYPVTSIGYEAFYDCSSLTSITIPDSVTEIEWGAFCRCSSLTSVTIPDSVLNIGYYAFEYCSSLNSVKIPDSVLNIGDEAFYDCSSLTSVTIGDSVLNIGYNAFDNTAYYNNINNWENKVLYIGNYLIRAQTKISGAYEIKSGTKVIADYAFSGCSSLPSVTIPDSVTSIGNYAFFKCSSLTSITIPDSVTEIKLGAFCRCSSLKSVIIPDSVLNIGEDAFWSCSSLTSVTIGDSVLNIGNSAFSGCSSLTFITIPDSVTSIGKNAFFSTAYYNNSNNWENNVLYIGNYLIEAKDDISGAYEIKSGTKVIADYAFSRCYSLTSVIIPDSVLNIGEGAFSNCSSLPSVTIPNSVTKIELGAFSGCSSLTSVTIGDSVLNIGYRAFDNTAYYNNSNNWENNVLYIGNYLIEAKNDISGDYEIKSGTKVIADLAFYYCDSLTSVIIPNSVLNIGKWAFSGCDNLTIYGYSGSAAEDYALENEIKFVSLGCSHKNTTVHQAKESTCIVQGNNKYTTCNDCGAVISGSDAKLPLAGHVYDNACDTDCNICGATRVVGDHVYDNACDTDCNICGANREVGDHVYDNACDTDCNICGATREVGDHVYDNACDTDCNICGATRTVSGHKYTNACDTDCNECGVTRTTTHTYKTTTTKATLIKNGSIVKKCSVCGKVASTTTIYYPKTVSIAATTYTYTGKFITPAVTVKNSKGTALKKGTDYTVTYASGRKNVGKYKVTVTFKGNYSGTKTFYFTINPVKTTLSKLTAGSKSIKVAITKKSTEVTGYQIQYSTSKTFKSAKTATIKNNKTTSTTLTKLTAKKTYYVRVRTYKTVGKTNYYSGWSTYKKVTTKK